MARFFARYPLSYLLVYEIYNFLENYKTEKIIASMKIMGSMHISLASFQTIVSISKDLKLLILILSMLRN
ncbi:unnamed protein product [Blepharisma stoltei]|uniref:Maturase K n=1 Tax=Blepharisma stoltei TaxID=1481888 RepID=A0AAU9J482_9CILI|nr:unnamed protein product [Blepharisma stoltei]